MLGKPSTRNYEATGDMSLRLWHEILDDSFFLVWSSRPLKLVNKIGN